MGTSACVCVYIHVCLYATKHIKHIQCTHFKVEFKRWMLFLLSAFPFTLKNRIKFNILLQFKNRLYSFDSYWFDPYKCSNYNFCHMCNDSSCITRWMSFMIFYSWQQITVTCKIVQWASSDDGRESHQTREEIFTVLFHFLCFYRWIYRQTNNEAATATRRRHLHANSSCCRNSSPENRVLFSLKLSYSFLCVHNNVNHNNNFYWKFHCKQKKPTQLYAMSLFILHIKFGLHLISCS